MTVKLSYTLSEIARRLDVPQHRLIHLCEKGVVVPEIHDAAGRGSSRVFSEDNFLELAVALRLRAMMLPVSAVGAIVHVLRRFGREVRGRLGSESLAKSLGGSRSPELRIIVSDGEAIYFTLALPDKKPALFGGIPLAPLLAGRTSADAVMQGRSTSARHSPNIFGGPEASNFARMELSVTAVARSLPLG